MVSQSLPLETRSSLRQNGYRLETSYGWDTHEVPLYVHRPGAIRPRGEVGFKMRVGNLKQFDPAEAQYLARKGSQGFFLWNIDECLKHEFTPISVLDRPGGGIIVEKAPVKVFGCKWCRESADKGLQGGAEAVVPAPVESTDEMPNSAPLAVANGIACTVDDCDFVTSSVNKAGKSLSEARQIHALSLHTKRKHA